MVNNDKNDEYDKKDNDNDNGNDDKHQISGNDVGNINSDNGNR